MYILQNNILSIPNIIGGSIDYGNNHSFLKSPFPGNNYKIKIPNSTKQDVQKALKLANSSFSKCQNLTIAERKKILYNTADSFIISKEIMKIISSLTGMPIGLQAQKILETKKLLKKIADSVESDYREKIDLSNRIASILIPPNDPREWAFFLGNLVMTGIPGILKPSSKNPIIGVFLAQNLINNGYPKNAIHIINFDSKINADVGKEIIMNTDLKILMGDSNVLSKLGNTQIFNADNSRAIIDSDADISLSLEGIMKGFFWPHSCLSPKNVYIVGKEKYELVLERLKIIFQSFRNEVRDIYNFETKIGFIEKDAIVEFKNILENELILDQIEFVFPLTWNLFEKNPGFPVLVKSFYKEDSPLMTSPLPVYFIGLHYVSSLNEAVEHLNSSTTYFGNATKSMALSIYSNSVKHVVDNGMNFIKKNNKKMLLKVHDLKINNHTVEVDGIIHQGVNLREFLLKSIDVMSNA